MSAENAPRKKRIASDTTPVPDGDHRKRRRNRTTQSCLNCHTSKRMCDRKRPACARCTQLGLTGLCVYEVDDPSQRLDAQDESSRLIKRVAELEGVIRELKNKPHPRWVQSSQPGGSDESSSSNAPSPPISSPSSDRGDSSPRQNSSLNPTTPPKTSLYPLSIQSSANYDTRRKSPYLLSPLESTPSPGLMTPTDEYPFSSAGIAGQGGNQDYDLTTMFLNYPGLIGLNDGGFSPVHEARPHKHHSCSCLHDPTSYNTMLELSVRLRKASDVLSQSSCHHNGTYCHLHQRISELDSFTINALSDITHTPRGMPPESQSQGYHPSQMYSQRMPSNMRGSSLNVRPWDMMSSNASSPAPLDDSFMSWEPPRRS
ncbi:hypothetical protein JR316_0002344 [Psilocybe cubensis]|uniref:Zn(2)-C6 fungal-type domain-containing protein n=2 Tax=Psilocybe cubensis TaxID=181762 RepID=A0A8H7Y832_PSICU|nr:hypothetical protein JR316_0002344 [Psilocybe cubensis]KAH9485436.1 hypothetical protein JR316_0002344 [Psilocybe cubensis]